MSIQWNTLPREDLKRYLDKSTAKGLFMLSINWGMILASFALVMLVPAWYTVVIAMCIVGGRQLGLGILMHESAHRSLVSSGKLGEWIGNWLCAAPVFIDLAIYRAYHMTHHVKTGTDEDPDLGNYKNYPVSTASLFRKFARDLSGITGARAIVSLVILYGTNSSEQRSLGFSYQQSVEGAAKQVSMRTLLATSYRIMLVNLLMFGVCLALNQPLLYLLWPASWLTTYMVFTRIRNVAEHGALDGTRSNDMWINTRTVKAAWWERLFVAPNYVNYHFEHHLAPTVPSYNLPKLHAWLVAQGAYQRANMEPGYFQVLAKMRKTADEPAD